jgi:tRNA nucleotidyltransferase (CCA-adding enzyme)
METLKALPEWVKERLHEAGKLADQLDLTVFLVGGIVRDVFLDHVRMDIDLAVVGDGIQFAKRLARKHQGRMTAHGRFGTATVNFPDHTKLDIATARSERYEKSGALPQVTPDTLEADLARRDFSVNAMAICLNAPHRGMIIDPHGGRRDLDHRLIRILHEQSFVDDPTRLFRAVRFEKRLQFHLEQRTEQVYREAVAAHHIDGLSAGRLLEQVRLVCAEREVWPIFKRLDELGVWQAIYPTLAVFDGLASQIQAINGLKNNLNRPPKDIWHLYWLALLSPCTLDTIHRLAERLKPGRRLKEAMQDLPAMRAIAERVKHKELDNPGAFYKAAQSVSEDTILFFAIADKDASVRKYCSAYYDEHRSMRPAINGLVLQDLGIPQGPVYRHILETILIKKINGEIKTEQEERRSALEVWHQTLENLKKHK